MDTNDMVQIKAIDVCVGDVLPCGTVTAAVTIGTWVRIDTDTNESIYPLRDTLIEVREVVTD